MEYERYKKYFLARKFWFRYVGIALVGLGAAMFIIGYFSHAFFILPAGIVFAVVGAVVGWVPSTGRANEKEVLAVIEKKTESCVDTALEKTGLKFKMADNMPPQKLIGFVYNEENPYIRRGEDGHWRTSECVCTTLIFTNAGICAVGEKVSLIDDSAPEMTRRELLFADFDGAHFDTEKHTVTYGKDTVEASFSHLVFTLGDAEVFSVPADKSATLEIMIGDMLRHRETALRHQSR